VLKELIPKIDLRAKIYNNILFEKNQKQQISEVIKIIYLNDYN